MRFHSAPVLIMTAPIPRPRCSLVLASSSSRQGRSSQSSNSSSSSRQSDREWSPSSDLCNFCISFICFGGRRHNLQFLHAALANVSSLSLALTPLQLWPHWASAHSKIVSMALPEPGLRLGLVLAVIMHLM